ncbi:hypothetical protein PC111_g7015 [Phytophthora cactorum]|nr:hypothetical protein PC111_g7015 [Phytophthora cactorum]KAG2913140.1 hypothetical protein PC114_g8644 [Phytophthora cactorum]
MESDDSMSVLLPMVSLMLLLVFAGGLWFLRTRNQLRGASQSFLARMLLQEQETVTRLDLERGEAQAERWKCSVCEFSNAMDRPTCMLCGTKNSKREELPRLKQSIAGRDERLSSTSSITMLTRPSLTAQRSTREDGRSGYVVSERTESPPSGPERTSLQRLGDSQSLTALRTMELTVACLWAL